MNEWGFVYPRPRRAMQVGPNHGEIFVDQLIETPKTSRMIDIISLNYGSGRRCLVRTALRLAINSAHHQTSGPRFFSHLKTSFAPSRTK
jgi:hypothetical protein